MLARRFVLICATPRIERHRLSEVRSAPFRFVCGAGKKCVEPELCRGIMSGIEAILVQRRAQSLYLRPSCLSFGLADLPEVLRPHITREQPDNNHDNEQLEECKTRAKSLSAFHVNCGFG